jgi:diacylglycerol kinase (ATP)
MTGQWFVIVNPNAGKQKGKHDWLGIAALLSTSGIGYLSYFTEHRGHAMELTRKFIGQGFKNVIVVGGDGTLNEVVNGIFTQGHTPPSEITIAMIPVGTGNDWCRMFGIPADYQKAIDIIVKGNSFRQDIGVLEFSDIEGKRSKRYFANIAGMGFDAMVAEKTNIQKDQGKGNPLSYFVNILRSLFDFKITRTTISLDDRKINPDIFSMAIGIGRFNGGGMKQAPLADPDDGLFDITVIRPIGKFKIIRNVIKLFDGSFTKLPEVSTYRSSRVRIDSVPDLFAEADGESLGHSPFVINVLPRSLNIMVNGNR